MDKTKMSDTKLEDIDDVPMKGILTPQYKKFRDDTNQQPKQPPQFSWRDIWSILSSNTVREMKVPK